MGATFFICDPARQEILDRLVDEMEAEDPLEDVEDSAYDRFATELAAHNLASIALSDEASAPAEAFYEWFHERVSHDLDKLYLTAAEAKNVMASLERQSKKKGMDELVSGFWHVDDDFTRETAMAYFQQFQEALRKAVELNGLMAICYQ